MSRLSILVFAALGCADKDAVLASEEPVSASESMTGEEFHDEDSTGSDETGSSGVEDNPSADAEICDGEDNDGDGEIDEGLTSTFYVDEDGDGWGGEAIEACDQPPDTVTAGGDCNDDRADINPDAEEICNDTDDDCDEAVDEGLASTFFMDADSDGYGNPAVAVTACAAPDDYVDNSLDCDDSASLVSPDKEEVCNGIDDNCDGRADEGVGRLLYPDMDGDGYGDTSAGVIACWDLLDHGETPGDCDDDSADINPEADEICDDLDNDCDGEIDEHAVAGLTSFWMDADGDGHGAGEALMGCDVPDGFAATNDDCDDLDPLRAPSLTEECNGYDDDCDADIDEGVMSAFYTDSDGDGWGTGAAFFACEISPGSSTLSTDCDDSRADVYPDALEVCDGLDNDCNAIPDDEPTDGDTFYADLDGDGYGDPTAATVACDMPPGYVDNYTDCDPEDEATYPGAPESCDGRDNDCDGAVDDDPTDAPTWYADDDRDGYGSPEATFTDCEAPDGYVAWAEDCDDDDPEINPDAEERCNDADDDCDGEIDEDPVDGDIYFYDSDGDGYGAGDPVLRCIDGTGWVDNADDCDDYDDSSYPDAPEYCDGEDQNCDGLADNGADCPCEHLNWSGDSYMFCELSKKWTQSRNYCQDYGYNLISVNSGDEQTFIINTIRYDSSVTNTAYWIGLNDRSSERGSSRSYWSWQAGDSYVYQAWSDMYGGQPDDYGGEDCVEVNRWNWRAAGSDWNDLDCNDRIYFICEAN